MPAYCAHCGRYEAHPQRYCPYCGAAWPADVAAPRAGAPPAAPAPGDANRSTMGLAVLALVLNALVLPGLGSLIGGDMNGVWQLALVALAVVLFIAGAGTATASAFLLGFLLALIAWVGGLVTGVRLVQRAQ